MQIRVAVVLLALAVQTIVAANAEPNAPRTFVITGASSGIGRAVAVKLGARGANVVLAARREKLLEEVARDVHAAGGRALVVPTDVSNPAEIERLARAATEYFGHADVWINDAGVGALGRFWEVPLRDHARTIDVDLKGVIYGSHAALRLFAAQGYGTLINLGSVESDVPIAYQSSYSAAKAGVRNLDQAINEDLRLAGLRNIKVVTIMPWAIDTPFWSHLANYTGRKPRMLAMDDPEKVANAIVRAADRPHAEIPVGWKGRGATAAHHLFPHPTEHIASNIEQHELDKAAPAAVQTGNLYQPMHSGRAIEGGVRARMMREDHPTRVTSANE